MWIECTIGVAGCQRAQDAERSEPIPQQPHGESMNLLQAAAWSALIQTLPATRHVDGASAWISTARKAVWSWRRGHRLPHGFVGRIVQFLLSSSAHLLDMAAIWAHGFAEKGGVGKYLGEIIIARQGFLAPIVNLHGDSDYPYVGLF